MNFGVFGNAKRLISVSYIYPVKRLLSQASLVGPHDNVQNEILNTIQECLHCKCYQITEVSVYMNKLMIDALLVVH